MITQNYPRVTSTTREHTQPRNTCMQPIRYMHKVIILSQKAQLCGRVGIGGIYPKKHDCDVWNKQLKLLRKLREIEWDAVEAADLCR